MASLLERCLTISTDEADGFWWGYWGGWYGYWHDGTSGFAELFSGGYGLGAGWAGWYGYGYNGGAITQNTDLGSREAAIAAQASSAATYTPPAEATPGSVHFGEGLVESSFVAAVVPVETMLASRDSLFAQTNKQSFWADSLNQQGPTFDGPSAQYLLNLASAVQGQSNGSQPTFDELVDAAYDEIGFEIPEPVSPAPSEVPEEGEGEDPEAAPVPEPTDYKLDLQNIPASRMSTLVAEGKAFPFSRTVNSAVGKETVVVVPQYNLVGEFIRNDLFLYQVGRGREWYKYLTSDSKTKDAAYYGILADVKYFEQREAARLQSNESQLTFVLHLIPGGAATDYYQQGDIVEGTISLAGDAAMIVSFGGSKIFTSARALNTARKAVVVTEGVTGTGRLAQSVYHFTQEEHAQGAGELGEAFLRLAGLTPAAIKLLRKGAKADDALGAAAEAVDALDNTASNVAADVAEAAARGIAREHKVAELVGGTVSREVIVVRGLGRTDIDVIGPAGQLISVGGPAKAASHSVFGRQLQILKAAANERGVTALMYFEEGTPQSTIDLAKRWLGSNNVFTFPK